MSSTAERAGVRARPLDLQHAVGFERGHADQARAVAAMHRNAASEGGVAGNRLRAQRRATARERGRQISHALDLHRRCVPARPRGARGTRRRRRGLEQPRRRVHQLRDGDFALTEQLVKVIDIACLELLGKGCQLLGSRTDARELTLGDPPRRRCGCHRYRACGTRRAPCRGCGPMQDSPARGRASRGSAPPACR